MNYLLKKNQIIILVILLITLSAALWMLFAPVHLHHGDDHHHGAHGQEDETPKGPHGGRLLSQDDFSLELTIFESGVPPEFRIYAYEHGKPLPPEAIDLTIELSRLDGQLDHFEFTPEDDFLRGAGVVTEPHSFDVSVKAAYKDKTFVWQYDNYEGRTQISPAMADAAGVKMLAAGPQTIHEKLTVTGRVQTDPNKMAHVRARFPGVIHAVKADLGDIVRRGDVLASVQSNESLQNYMLKAPIDGLIIHRQLQLGEATTDAPLYIIADVSRLWVEFDLFSRDLSRVSAGQSIRVETLEGQSVTGNIHWVSPMASHTSQSVHARVIIDNTAGLFRPGQFVRGHITIAEHQVPLAVRQSAIQRFRDFQVVFARFNDTYEVRMLELGRHDDTWMEVLGGLKPGTEYVSENSYLIKADIEKSGASHDH